MACKIDDDVVRRLSKARSIAVLTGAGVAAESGVPTFGESQTGQWARYDLAELATAQGFVRNPRLVWDWYDYRRSQMDQCQPNAAHYALVDLEQHDADFMLITQTIDGLHWRTGSRELIEVHGNIHRARCFECGSPANGYWEDDLEQLPRCAHCGGLLRPDVVLLGEGIPANLLRMAYQVAEQADIFLSIGTSAEVQPAASLPLIAKRAGAFMIEINPRETALSIMADCWIPAPASDALPALVSQIDDNLRAYEEGM